MQHIQGGQSFVTWGVVLASLYRWGSGKTGGKTAYEWGFWKGNDCFKETRNENDTNFRFVGKLLV